MSMRRATLVTDTPDLRGSVGTDPAELGRVFDTVRAFVWDVQLDPDGEGTSAEVYRAMIRSTDHLGFAQVQGAIDGGTTDSPLSLFKAVGQQRISTERARGAGLPTPVREIRVDGAGYVVFDDGVPKVIVAPVVGECTAGAAVTIRLTEADVVRRRVRLEVVGE